MPEGRHGCIWWLGSLFWGALLLGLGAVCLLGYGGAMDWRLDLFAHFRLQYLLAALILSLLLFLLRRWFLFFFALCLLLLNAVEVLREAPNASPQPGATIYRALSVNVYSGNSNVQDALDYIERMDADFIALIEITGLWREALEQLNKRYPYQEVRVWGDDFGYALLSKYPFTARDFAYVASGSLAREVETPSGRLILLQCHPLAPMNERAWQWRNEMLQKIALFCAEADAPVLALGDFNCTPWSPHFKAFLEVSGLQLPGVGWGLRRTWPAGRPWLWIPIDHVLLSPPLVASDGGVGPDVGSDHHPVWLDFLWADQVN